MKHLTTVAASIAVLAHVLFFLLESVMFDDPEVYTGFGLDAAGAEIVAVFMFNQGFYNLFLALGTLAGLVLLRRGRVEAGRALLTFGCTFMVGAAIVLFFSAPDVMTGVLMQGTPPLVALMGLRLEGAATQ